MQGFNMGRYYPPDASNAPSFNAKPPLSSRTKPSGALTVRFELPFAVWCAHCKPEAIVGQGVRFNAEKKKVGNYYSTPIWSFRMKHSACGGWWEIRTDPKNAKYVVVEKKAHTERLGELYDAAEMWRDPYDVNARLRREFREKRKRWKKEDRVKEGMQEKFSFGYEIADATESDVVRAKMVDFGAGAVDEDVQEVVKRPLFTSVKATMTGTGPKKKLKAEIAAEKSRQSLQQSLVGNTRASIDPFLSTETKSSSKLSLGIKRKREEQAAGEVKSLSSATILSEQSAAKAPALTTALVDYDSD
ncbi:hypothetical protein PMIN07_003511 [Paraphaeosphaeria minitans]